MTDAYAAGWQDAPLLDAELPEGQPRQRWQQAPSLEPAKEKGEPSWSDYYRGVKQVLTGPDRYQTWPERLVRQTLHEAGQTLAMPGEVYRGELDPMSDEAIKRSAEGAFLFSPVSPGHRLGSRYGAPPRPPASPAEQAGRTAYGLGEPLPRGYTGGRASQAVTQAIRGTPVFGEIVGERVAATRRAADEALGTVSAGLGNPERGVLGLNMRGAMDDLVEANRTQIDDLYNNARSLINPSTVHVPRHTQQAFNNVVQRRLEARQPNPEAGLEQIRNIIDQGVNFNGLIRAKNDLAQQVDFLGVHAGFSEGDRKLIGAAMRRDLHEYMTTAVPPNMRQRAMQALTDAETSAAQLIRQNQRLRQLTTRTDESLAGALLGAGQVKGGDIQLLAQLRNSLPPEQFAQIAGSTLRELGFNPASNAFSLDRFATQWANMSQAGKSVLFTPQHRRFLDDIAQLGTHIKEAEQLMNRSRTGAVVGLNAVLAGVGQGFSAAFHGDFALLTGLTGQLGATWAVAQAMAKPSTAGAMARFARAATAYNRQPSQLTAGALRLATENAAREVRSSIRPDEMIMQTFPNRPEGSRQQPAQDIPVPQVPYNPNVL